MMIVITRARRAWVISGLLAASALVSPLWAQSATRTAPSTTVVVDRETGMIVPGFSPLAVASPGEILLASQTAGNAPALPEVNTPSRADYQNSMTTAVPETGEAIIAAPMTDASTAGASAGATPATPASSAPVVVSAWPALSDAPAAKLPAVALPGIESPSSAPVSGDTAVTTTEIRPMPDFAPLLLASGDDQLAFADAIRGALGDPSLAIPDEILPALSTYYNDHAFAPVFVNDPIGVETSLRALIDAVDHGLPAARYQLASLAAPASDVKAKARFEVELAARVLQYSRDQEKGLVLPRSLGDEFDFEPSARDYSAYLPAYGQSADKAQYFNALLPNDPAYLPMVAELKRLRALGGQGIDAAKVPAGKTLRPGDSDNRVALLRARLAAMGYKVPIGAITGSATEVTEAILADIAGVTPVIASDTTSKDYSPPANPAYFDQGLEAVVRAYQSDAGIDVDGVVGPSTLANINAGPEEKIRSLIVGLERQRWGSDDRDGRQIFVNIANFMAEIRDNNAKSFETRVVVGKNKDGWRTPEFNDEMTHLIVNPKWYVPESISVREYLPKIQADPGYLERNNITMKIAATGQVVSPRQIDMRQFTVDDFPFSLVQGEGDDNALGDVKFMFPNSHNIYLHDTPSKSLFARAARAFSHGCVRVADPVDLAKALLAPQTHDPAGTYSQLLATGKERRVDLAQPVPIHLTYFTAYLNDTGAISFANDSYGRDIILKSQLEAEGVVF